MISCIVVDDEEMALERLTREIEKRPGWQVLSRCSEYEEAKQALIEHEPDVCFMDINIIAGSGMELAKALSSLIATQWIFSTAYSEYAVDAFDINAFGYLLKPYENDKLKRLMHKFENHLSSDTKQDVHSSKLAIKSIGEVKIVDVNDIIWIKGASNYLELYFADRMLLHRETLTSIQKKLSKKNFFRVHRSAIVNIDYISKVDSELGRYSSLIMKNGDEVKISSNFKHELFKALGIH
ncbi:LytTR family DNA-binding domain-containing protein [Thalassotalea sp. PP2-459]|uniref:LytR/AlgR family response regulator transcription factor n=1 Tax=Thalassotalea sp. PP2-459 TaxID=1742724 RepID=UPI000942B881|nr:LytTR family DNA-binding domain-containing protein [Thalassotalea sp. PP2-459]OKY26982.1 DNA-binding response regulator [Thalassotalea sp. PP2-459]